MGTTIEPDKIYFNNNTIYDKYTKHGIFFLGADHHSRGVELGKKVIDDVNCNISISQGDRYFRNFDDELGRRIQHKFDSSISSLKNKLESMKLKTLDSLLVYSSVTRQMMEAAAIEVSSALEEIKMEREKRFPYGYLNMTCDKEGHVVKIDSEVNNEEKPKEEIRPSFIKRAISRLKSAIPPFSDRERMNDFLEME